MSDEWLTTTERAVLLKPCDCGHTINDHGSLVACWVCEDRGGECGSDFEALLVERVGVIVAGRARQEGPPGARGSILTASETGDKFRDVDEATDARGAIL